MSPTVPATLKRPRAAPRFFAPWEMRPMPAGWQTQANAPISASDPMIPEGVDEKAVRKEPAAQPKKPIARASRLPKRSAKNPQGRAHRPNRRYMGNPSARTSSRLMFSDSVSGMASAGKAISWKWKRK